MHFGNLPTGGLRMANVSAGGGGKMHGRGRRVWVVGAARRRAHSCAAVGGDGAGAQGAPAGGNSRSAQGAAVVR